MPKYPKDYKLFIINLRLNKLYKLRKSEKIKIFLNK